MAYEEERLRILQRVSAGELTPEEGSLQIAMLRVGRAPAQPPLDPVMEEAIAPPRFERERPFAGHPFASRHAGPVTWPVLVALALPFLLVAGLAAAFAAGSIAVLTWLAVAVWNQAVAAHWLGGQPIGFFPTCWYIAVFAALWTALRWRRRLRDAFGR
jgi:hypothetical protein